jgi:hypothetical protein
MFATFSSLHATVHRVRRTTGGESTPGQRVGGLLHSGRSGGGGGGGHVLNIEHAKRFLERVTLRTAPRQRILHRDTFVVVVTRSLHRLHLLVARYHRRARLLRRLSLRCQLDIGQV